MFYRILRSIDEDLEQWVFQREERVIINLVALNYVLFFLYHISHYAIINVILIFTLSFTISLMSTYWKRINKLHNDIERVLDEDDAPPQEEVVTDEQEEQEQEQEQDEQTQDSTSDDSQERKSQRRRSFRLMNNQSLHCSHTSPLPTAEPSTTDSPSVEPSTSA
jgi:hypothetical protein